MPFNEQYCAKAISILSQIDDRDPEWALKADTVLKWYAAIEKVSSYNISYIASSDPIVMAFLQSQINDYTTMAEGFLAEFKEWEDRQEIKLPSCLLEIAKENLEQIKLEHTEHYLNRMRIERELD